MKCNWTTKKLSEIAYINPRESLGKGVVAKKVPMDKLQPFCRDIPEFVLEEYKGGTKFRNGDTIMARITPCLENGKIAKVSVLSDGEVGFGSTEYIVFRAIDGVSETLIEKIHTMTSPGQASKLKRNNYVVNRIKPDNEQIYYIIDAINDAINAGKQISFQYYDYTGLKKKVLKNKGEVYKLSPYKLLWCGDYYYVLGYSEKKSKVINFRVDRIASKPEILDKDIIPLPDDFDIENYTKEVFFMFSGEKVLVDLRCDNSLMKTMVDRFGEDVTTLAYDMTSFRVQTEVSASPTFFGWVFGFNGKVQILAPESVKEQYRQMIAKADEDMQESE